MRSAEVLEHRLDGLHTSHVRILLVGRLDPVVWGAPKRVDVVHSVVRWQLANRRQGTAMVRRPVLHTS